MVFDVLQVGPTSSSSSSEQQQQQQQAHGLLNLVREGVPFARRLAFLNEPALRLCFEKTLDPAWYQPQQMQQQVQQAAREARDRDQEVRAEQQDR